MRLARSLARSLHFRKFSDMKVALVLTFCGLVMVSGSPEHDEVDIEAKVDVALQDCREEVGFFVEKRKPVKSLTPEEKKTFDCLTACMFKKLRFMKANGELDKEFIFDHSPQRSLQNIRKSIEDCKPKHIGDACKLAGCIRDYDWFDLPMYKHLILLNKE